jgi:GNAT superfamily N-acetyltransferase
LKLSAPELLSADHDLSQFDSGKPALDDWLRTRALSNQQKGFTVVMVVHEAGRVVGYYGLAPTAVEPTIAPRKIRTGQPPNPMPCLLLGQLATDRSYAGNGVGIGLLKHALRRCLNSAELTGGRAVIVHAIDDEAAEFWRRRGFLPSPSDPYRLFRSIADIQASLSEAERPPA